MKSHFTAAYFYFEDFSEQPALFAYKGTLHGLRSTALIAKRLGPASQKSLRDAGGLSRRDFVGWAATFFALGACCQMNERGHVGAPAHEQAGAGLGRALAGGGH